MKAPVSIAGAWYVDALVTGEYVAVFRDGRIRTHLGEQRVSPEHLPLYVRCTNVGGFRFAGQAWGSGHAIEWSEAHGWRDSGINAHGTSPVIYGASGDLLIATPDVGSQGWRYIDRNGLAVTGDTTLRPVDGWWRLWEWTKLADDLVIGQGEYGGCIVWDAGVYRALVQPPASVRFIRGTRSGDDVAVAWWGESGVESGYWVGTIADLRALPEATVPMPTLRVPKLARPAWLIPYHATRHTKSIVCPGHAEIISNGHDAGIRKVRRPVIADLETEPTADDVLAIGCDAHPDKVAAARPVADRRGVPLFVYHDYRTPFPEYLGLQPGWDWIGVMLYSNPGETIEAFAGYCRAQLAHASTLGQPVAMVVQMFDRNGKEKDLVKIARLQALWAELYVEFPSVVAICPFAVLRDVHGVTAYPFLQDALAQYEQAMTAPARPTRQAPPAPPPPPPSTPVYDPLPFLRDVYLELLHREPDTYGLGYYGARLIDGRMTEADVRADITRSPEYRALHAPPPLTGLAGFRQAAEEAATELKESER